MKESQYSDEEVKEIVHDVRREVERERERLAQEAQEKDTMLRLLDMVEELRAEVDRLKDELAAKDEELERMHQQWQEEKEKCHALEVKLSELNKLSVGMAKKSPQEGLEKAFRTYINTSRRKTPAKREVAKAQLLDFIVTAKLEMPDDIMDMLEHLDDEQTDGQAATVTVQAGGINVQQANVVKR